MARSTVILSLMNIYRAKPQETRINIQVWARMKVNSFPGLDIQKMMRDRWKDSPCKILCCYWEKSRATKGDSSCFYSLIQHVVKYSLSRVFLQINRILVLVNGPIHVTQGVRRPLRKAPIPSLSGQYISIARVDQTPVFKLHRNIIMIYYMYYIAL